MKVREYLNRLEEKKLDRISKDIDLCDHTETKEIEPNPEYDLYRVFSLFIVDRIMADLVKAMEKVSISCNDVKVANNTFEILENTLIEYQNSLMEICESDEVSIKKDAGTFYGVKEDILLVLNKFKEKFSIENEVDVPEDKISLQIEKWKIIHDVIYHYLSYIPDNERYRSIRWIAIINHFNYFSTCGLPPFSKEVRTHLILNGIQHLEAIFNKELKDVIMKTLGISETHSSVFENIVLNKSITNLSPGYNCTNYLIYKYFKGGKYAKF